jgi:Bacterial regulatory proteins, tetR family
MSALTRTPPNTWIEAGLRALSAGGVDAVRIELLAQQLNVTRGSFYWHFQDRQAFLEQMLDTWERKSTDEVLERVESGSGDAKDKIRRAGMLTSSLRCKLGAAVGGNASPRRDRRADIRDVDVPVCQHSYPAPNGCCQNPFRGEAGGPLLWLPTSVGDVDEDDVGLHLGRIDRPGKNLGDSGGQFTGVLVVFD